MNFSRLTYVRFSLLVSFVFLLPSFAHASRVYVTSEAGEFYAGDSVVLTVRVDSQGKEINSIEGNVGLKIPTGVASIQNVNVSGSIFSLWPRKPSFDSRTNTFSFVGGAPGGLNQEDAAVFKIVLHLDKPGKVSVTPANIAAYLHDGLGTRDVVEVEEYVLNIVAAKDGRAPADEWSDALSQDRTPPEVFVVSEGREASVFDGKRFLSFNAVDAESGIKYYEVTEGDLPTIRSGTTYVLQEQEISQSVIVAAYDGAGNVRQVKYDGASNSGSNWGYLISIGALVLLGAYIWRSRTSVVVGVVLLTFFVGAGEAEAARLYTQPSQPQVLVGDIVSVSVLVDTAGVQINNAESLIQYSQDFLEIVSIDKTSIFSLWVQEPTYSNNTGQLSFNGGVPNPGFQGSAGKVMSVVFRAKKAGTTSIVLLNSAIRANDGFGTDVLTSKTGSTFTISAQKPQEPAVQTPMVKDAKIPSNLEVTIDRSEYGNILFRMRAIDESGIDRFVVTSGASESVTVKADANGQAVAEMPFSAAGEHAVTVTVFDKSGNSVSKEVVVNVEKASELSINSYANKIRVNESFELSGMAPYAQAAINIFLQHEDDTVDTYKVKSDSYSAFAFISSPITKKGNYTVWAEIAGRDGSVAFSSNKVLVMVEEPLLLKIGSYTIGLMSVLIPAAALVLIFMLFVLYGWHKFYALYRSVRREAAEAERINTKSFKLLKEDLKGYVSSLKRGTSRRRFTVKEIEFLERFEEELDEAEKIIGKEIRDVTKQ